MADLICRVRASITAFVQMYGHAPNTVYLGYDEWGQFRASDLLLVECDADKPKIAGLAVYKVCEQSLLQVALIYK